MQCWALSVSVGYCQRMHEVPGTVRGCQECQRMPESVKEYQEISGSAKECKGVLKSANERSLTTKTIIFQASTK